MTGHAIRNEYLQAALIRLATLPARGQSYDQDRAPQPIDYRDLSVRHLGSLYEGLLEYKLFVVQDEPRVVRGSAKKTRYVPYSQAGKVRANETMLEVGAVYFSETEGERKSTGSYYTPEDVVDYIVRHTVGEKLAALKAAFYAEQAVERQLADLANTPPDVPAHRQIRAALDQQYLRFVRQKVLDLKILDPAMGSGHFLVNATHAVADFVVELLNETPWAAVPDAGDLAGAAIDTDVATWKRRVAERCIFGVDLNELAVELAKLCLWMSTAAKGKPLTFLDHHLRWGNSLVGAWLQDVGAYPRAKKESQKAFTLPLGRFQVDLDGVLAAYEALYAKHSDDVEDVREKARIFDEQIYPALAPYRELLDLHTGVYFGNGLDAAAYAQLGAAISDPDDWERLKVLGLDTLLTQHADQHWFHWELEFPEVFAHTNQGVSAVIGNPPYIETSSLPYKPLTSAVQKCGNTYASFFEVAARVVSHAGKYGMVVPISIISTQRMAPLQNLLLKNSSVMKVANFAVRPATLFPGVDMNISIVTGTRSVNQSTEGNCRCLRTGYTRWYTDERQGLLDRLTFVDSTQFVTPERIPKLGLAIEQSILQKLRSDNALLSNLIDSEHGKVLYYHSGGRYWRKALLEDLSSQYKPLKVESRFFYTILALLNTNLFYWYWILFSDCYHVVTTDVFNFPIHSLLD